MEIEIRLPRPHSGQQKVIDSDSRFKVLLCGRRWGKSLVAQIIAIQKMLAGEKVSYVTPTFDLAKNFFNDVSKLIPETLKRVENKSDLIIELITGGFIKFFSGESLDRFRGYKFHYCIIDEAAFIPDLKNAWFSAIRPTLLDYQGGALFISTPRGKEFFYSLFQLGNDPNEKEYQSFHYKTIDNPYFPKEEYELAMKSIPEMMFRQEYMAIPGENNNNPFGTDNINRNIINEISNGETVVYGIDLAKSNDYTVITGLDVNGYVSYFDRFQLPWTLTIEKIKNLPEGILKVVDETGVGDAIVENLQNVTSNVIGFRFTQESKPKIMYELIKSIERNELKYPQIVADELHTMEYTYTSTGHIKFEGQSGYHDDCVMSLAIANHHRLTAIQDQNWTVYVV